MITLNDSAILEAYLEKYISTEATNFTFLFFILILGYLETAIFLQFHILPRSHHIHHRNRCSHRIEILVECKPVQRLDFRRQIRNSCRHSSGLVHPIHRRSLRVHRTYPLDLRTISRFPGLCSEMAQSPVDHNFGIARTHMSSPTHQIHHRNHWIHRTNPLD